MLPKGARYTLLSKTEKVVDVPFAGGTLALTTTTFTGVAVTLPTGENRMYLVYGYAESAIRMDTYTTGATTLH